MRLAGGEEPGNEGSTYDKSHALNIKLCNQVCTVTSLSRRYMYN